MVAGRGYQDPETVQELRGNSIAPDLTVKGRQSADNADGGSHLFPGLDVWLDSHL